MSNTTGTFSISVTLPDTGNTPTVDPDPAKIPFKQQGVINWTIKGQPKAVQGATIQMNWSHPQPNAVPIPGSSTLEVQNYPNTSKTPQKYTYTITWPSSDGTSPCRYDPEFENEPGP